MTVASTQSVGEASPKVREVDVLLVSMPFGPQLLHPSIGLSLLNTSLQPMGISSRILYLTFKLAKRIGTDLYRRLAYSEPTTQGFSGEWIFSGELFPDYPHDVEAYIHDVLEGHSPHFGNARWYDKKLGPEYIQSLRALRGQAGAFLDECVEDVLAHRPRIVGFTSTFQQHVASLALAKRLRERDKDLFILFGGANCEGVMGWETLQQFPFVDAVVSGEGDRVFSQLIQEVLAGKRPTESPGIFLKKKGLSLMRGAGNNSHETAPSVEEMDSLPYPDYSDFFEQFYAADLDFPDLKANFKPRLVFETSRGCWWGAKAHCTFCGLNGNTMAFRAKSGERAIDELTYLLDKHPGSQVSVVDNILDMKYFKDFIPELAARKLGTELFYEVKSNLSRKQVQMMRDAGIIYIQPGIESLSSRVLDLMKKGVTGIQNIQLLKWCKEFGIKAYWNMLWGFPGETAEDYRRVQEIVPLLTHLHPPGGHGVIRLDRFSPNFNKADEFGFVDVRPYPSYDFIYPELDARARFNMAYFFTFNYHDKRDVMSYVQPIADFIPEWQKIYPESDLFSVDKGDQLLIWDLRPVAVRSLTVLRDSMKTLFEACDGIASLSKLQKVIEAKTGKAVSQERIEEALQPLIKSGLIIEEDHTYLNLAVQLGEYSPSPLVVQKLERAVRALGKSEGNNIVVDVNTTNTKEVSADISDSAW